MKEQTTNDIGLLLWTALITSGAHGGNEQLLNVLVYQKTQLNN